LGVTWKRKETKKCQTLCAWPLSKLGVSRGIVVVSL
uniref:Ovule protein n=1 Tax=Brugia timori TaxID=42155 RepID=A0A0R3Q4Y0_9BILA